MTLPSNASMDIYPENKTSEFIVHLPNEINLTGNDWEVGLAEIFYPNSWYNFDSVDYWIYFRRGDVDILSEVPAGYYQNAGQVIQQLLKAMKQNFETKNKEKLADGTLTSTVAFLFDIKFNHYTQMCEFHIRHKKGAPTRFNANGEEEASVQLTLSETLANVLGFSQTSFSEVGIYAAERVVNIESVTAIFVYCDIIQHRTVGHTLAPLLSVIPVEGRSGALISKRYEKLQYHPILKKNIAEIHISLRDDQGNLIRFRKGKVIVTLHFQHRKL